MDIITQINHNVCGAVSLYNTAVLCGIETPSIKTIDNYCNRKPHNGTSITNLIQAAKKLRFPLERVEHRNKEGIYIVGYLTISDTYHWAVTDNKYIYNHWDGNSYIKESKFNQFIDPVFLKVIQECL
jgi:hypothetical protein